VILKTDDVMALLRSFGVSAEYLDI
jgi:hypothetical protein